MLETESPAVLTAAAAAIRLQVSRSTVSYMTQRGALVAVRQGRRLNVTLESVERAAALAGPHGSFRDNSQIARRLAARQRKARHARIREAYKRAALVGTTPSPAHVQDLSSNAADKWQHWLLADAGHRDANAVSCRILPGETSQTLGLPACLTPARGVDWALNDLADEFN